MIRLNSLLDHAAAYRAWQAPFAEAKFAPVFRHTPPSTIRRVLDVGCGPGTNTAHFTRCDYLGVDFNAGYIAQAKSRFGREFVVADITTYSAPAGEHFDFILVNSFLHHVDSANARRILAHLGTLLTADGHVHILDLVLPRHASLGRVLARWDRGDYARPLEEWRALFDEAFEPVVFEPYPLGFAGVTLWNMIYFKGRARL